MSDELAGWDPKPVFLCLDPGSVTAQALTCGSLLSAALDKHPSANSSHFSPVCLSADYR